MLACFQTSGWKKLKIPFCLWDLLRVFSGTNKAKLPYCCGFTMNTLPACNVGHWLWVCKWDNYSFIPQKRKLQYEYRRASIFPTTALSGQSVHSKENVLNTTESRGEEPVDLPHVMDKHDQQAAQVEGQENEYAEKTRFHIHRSWGREKQLWSTCPWKEEDYVGDSTT